MTTDRISSKFIKEVLKFLKYEDRVLDLGAGLGSQSERFARAGALVTAVDKRTNPKLKNIVWHKTSVEDFIANASNQQNYRIIFSQNLLQFLNKEWVFVKLLPWLKDHLEPGGIVAFKTFYQEPEQAFTEPLSSLYNADELQNFFNDYRVIIKSQEEILDSDMKGKIRKFFITKLIIQKLLKAV